MTPQEIFDILKECAGFELEKIKDDIHGFGAINRCPKCKGMSRDYYHNVHYSNMAKKTGVLTMDSHSQGSSFTQKW